MELTGRKVYYFSPSVLPSRTANSVHVVRMCEAFASLGCDVTLFCQRSVERVEQLTHALADYYGARLEGVRVESCYRGSPRGASLAIALHARSYLRADPPADPAVLVSRNLYASAWLALSGRGPLVFETHQVESGWGVWIQRYLMHKGSVRKVLVSNALRESLESRIGEGIDQCLVLHDAAPTGLPPRSRETTGLARSRLADRVAWQRYRSWAGYFGHLYPGRGIEIIEQLAWRHPEAGFLIVGGNPEDVAACKIQCTAANMHFVGHQPPAAALLSMHAVDVLLMPYQRRVSIGPAHSDTARWMSPMKMFEYMASGVPIIASKLPVLMEVLRHDENALLADPESVQEWAACLGRLLGDAAQAKRLTAQARAEYEAEHTWRHRAEKILAFSRN